MMQEKRIVGALQAEQNAKAAQTQAASQRAKDDYRAGEKAYDIAQASTQNTGSGKPLAMPVPVENRVTDKEREEAMTAYREGERNAVSIAEEYKSQVREEANLSHREGEREAVSIAEQARLNAVDAARWAGVASVAQAKENNPPWQEKITNAVGQAWDVTKTTTISAWNLTKTIATDFGNLVVETGKSLAYSFNQTVVPKLNSVFVSTQKALLSAWDDTKNVFIGIKNDIASIPFAIKDAAKENIPIVAEWLYQNRTIPVVTFAEKHPLATKVMTHILNRGIDSEKEKMRPFTDTNPESMTWTDLGKVWLYEYGDKDTIKFDSDAALTKEVMALDGVQSYREEVISNLRDGRIEDITQKPVEYGVDQFGHSLIDALMGKSGDLF
ncbi:MAG: hypothetical protein IPG80_08200 [Anaerolineales bacterium]|uniref:hypothetical protein n=1 Tax=Candidatus Villigracilis vicinus TaxID=3140679 RepID=UPI0031350EA5|nr:hypothetical protein [Anaerolineales bacterium]